MDQDALMARLRAVARDMGIVDIAAAPSDAWDTDPLVSSRVREGCRPSDILPGARSVVVVGIPIQRTVVDTAPSIWYNHLYGVVNGMLDQAAERLALELNALGHRAVYIPRDGYFGLAGLKAAPEAFFSHRHAAYLAGMGTFGWNNMLLTEAYGPRIRLGSVITDAVLPYGEVLSDDLCLRCGRCTRQCPASAVGGADYPAAVTDKTACTDHHSVLKAEGTTPCGRCIAVCPVGRDSSPSPVPAAMEKIRSFRKPATPSAEKR